MEPTDKQTVAPVTSGKAPEDMELSELRIFIENQSDVEVPSGTDKQAGAPDPSEQVPANAGKTDEAAPASEPAKTTDNPDELKRLIAEREELLARLEQREHSYKELQADHTRKSQELKRLKEPKPSTDSEDSSVLSRLRKDHPEAASIFDAHKAEIIAEVKAELKPLHEEREIVRKRVNVERFNQALTEFKKSDIAEFETELNDVFKENPEAWKTSIQENPHTFEALMREAIYRDYLSGKNRVVELREKKKKDSAAQAAKDKMINQSGVAGKPHSSVPIVADAESLKKMSLEDLSKIVPRA